MVFTVKERWKYWAWLMMGKVVQVENGESRIEPGFMYETQNIEI